MKNITAIATIAAIAAALVSGAAFAAPTAELKVTGVIKPPACVPSFASGGTVSFGIIPAASLKAGQYTQLPSKTIGFTITCDSPVKMALKASDNKVSSVVSGASGTSDILSYGLGFIGTKKIGAYMLHFSGSDVTADGVTAKQIFSNDGFKTWDVTGNGGALGNDRSFSWANAGGTTPAAFKTVSGSVTVAPFLNKPENLPLEQDIPLDGSATFEVQYL